MEGDGGEGWKEKVLEECASSTYVPKLLPAKHSQLENFIVDASHVRNVRRVQLGDIGQRQPHVLCHVRERIRKPAACGRDVVIEIKAADQRRRALRIKDVRVREPVAEALAVDNRRR